jgi:nicotinate-nucleotide pyrophosphorylase (carboxylating)
MKPPTDLPSLRQLLRGFLEEDLGSGDVTTLAIVPEEQKAAGCFVAKSPLVLAGIEIAVEALRLLDESVQAELRHRDGDCLQAGEEAACTRGKARALLSGERVALNLLQRLSGIATLTRRFVEAVQGTGAKILDTRKTTPGLRALEKYAVVVGGGVNHRMSLSDAVLIKDNHVRIAGGVGPAIRATQRTRIQPLHFEIEVACLTELEEALKHDIDAVLLDNMKPEEVRRAVKLVRSRPGGAKIRIEASGGITLQNVRKFAEAGADWVSIGALTHSAPAVDISFEVELA